MLALNTRQGKLLFFRSPSIRQSFRAVVFHFGIPSAFKIEFGLQSPEPSPAHHKIIKALFAPFAKFLRPLRSKWFRHSVSTTQQSHPMNHSARPTRRQILQTALASSATIALPALADWPEKPLKIIVTFAPGGASDIVARVMAEALAKKLGQPVIVDNRPGAGGSVGGLAVVQAPADGYTLMLS